MKVSVVILSMGDRPEALSSAIASARGQTDVDLEIVLVGNGATVDGDADIIDSLAENVGVAGGRNHGASLATGELLFFLDDDAVILGPDLCAQAVSTFGRRPELAVVSCRIVDVDTGSTQRRHIPRPGRSNASRGGDVTTFLGGAALVRRSAFERVGGFPDAFFYAHEETDLAWRLIEAGLSISYEPALMVAHPVTDPSRHDRSNQLSMRNRVLLAKRNLPWPLMPIYPTVWLLASVLRARSTTELRSILDGLKQGIRADVSRRPIGWSTVWRLTRLGRPPVF